MFIHSMIADSQVNGPGTRAVVWVQGCEINGPGKPGCKGCWNPETHAMHKKKMSRFDVFDWISQLACANRIDGITFSGGEPMHQAHDLGIMAIMLRQLHPKLTIGMYTGYTPKELQSGEYQSYSPGGCPIYGPGVRARDWNFLKQSLDFAVHGRFNRSKPCNKPLVSSKNQELVLYSDRLKFEDFAPQEVEVHITEDLIQVTGFPTGEFNL